MIIARVELEPCVMRKEDPTWRFALGANPVTDGVVVTLTAESGAQGFGYGSATPHMGATRESLIAALTGFAPLVTGRDSFAVEEILQALDAELAGNNQAKAAMDCALHDLNSRILGIPLHELLGGKLRDSVPILRILAIKTPEEMAVQAQKLTDAGYRYLKIKVHGDVTEDVARVRAILRRVKAAPAKLPVRRYAFDRFVVDLDSRSGELVSVRLVPMQMRRFRLQRVSNADAKWLCHLLDELGTAFGTGATLEKDGSLILKSRKE